MFLILWKLYFDTDLFLEFKEAMLNWQCWLEAIVFSVNSRDQKTNFHNTSVLLVSQHAQSPDGFKIANNMPKHWTETFWIHYQRKRWLCEQERGDVWRGETKWKAHPIANCFTKLSRMCRASMLRVINANPRRYELCCVTSNTGALLIIPLWKYGKEHFIFKGEARNGQHSFCLRVMMRFMIEWLFLVVKCKAPWTCTRRGRLKWREINWSV